MAELKLFPRGKLKGLFEPLEITGSEQVVGTSPSCQYSLQSVAREIPEWADYHFKVKSGWSLGGKKYMVMDMGSDNGTYIDYELAQPGRWHPVKKGQRVGTSLNGSRSQNLSFELNDKK